MTTIAVIRCEETRMFHVAADKQISYGYSNYVILPYRSKIREVYNGVMAFSGTCQKIDVLRNNACKLLNFNNSLDFYTKAHALYKKFELDSEKGKNGMKSNDVGGFLIRGDKMYRLFDSLEIDLWTKPYICTGSGSSYASGAIEALLGREHPEIVLRTAIEIASRNDLYTGDQIDYMTRSFDA